MMDYSKINLSGVFFISRAYSQKHAHMLHKHKGILELLYIAGGEGRYIVGNRGYAVKEGDLVICNAATIHGEAPFQEHTIETYCIALANYDNGALPLGCLIDKARKPVISLESFAAMAAQMMPSIYNLFTKDVQDKVICRQLAISLLMIVEKLLQEHDSQNKFIIEQKNENIVRELTEYLDANYTENITLEKLSRVMHISVSHTSHLLKRETGLSPMQYVIHRRIGEAQSLLAETQLPIKQIEEQLGFGSSCHLSAMFKKYVGLSPRAYRKYFTDEADEKEKQLL